MPGICPTLFSLPGESLHTGAHSIWEEEQRRNIEKPRRWLFRITLQIRAPQKSTFYATHLIFCSSHDVITLCGRVHVYCPLDLQYNVRHILSCHISAGQKQAGNNGMGKREAGETVSLFSREYYPEMPFHTAHSTGNFVWFSQKVWCRGEARSVSRRDQGKEDCFCINMNTTCLDTAAMSTRVRGGNIEASAIRSQPGSR